MIKPREILESTPARIRAEWTGRTSKQRALLAWQVAVEVAAVIWLLNGFSFQAITPVYQWY